MGGLGHVALAGVSAVIGLAIVAVVVSQNAQTGSVLTSAGTALSSVITAAVSPVTGGTAGMNFLGTGGSGSLLTGTAGGDGGSLL